jgi:hypothetical protein
VFNVFLYKDDVDRSDLNLNGLVLARAIREGALANHPGYASFLEGNEILTIKDEFRNMPFLTSGTLLYKIKFHERPFQSQESPGGSKQVYADGRRSIVFANSATLLRE